MTKLNDPVVNPIQECENAAISEGGPVKAHARLLTDAEWAAVLPPFCYIKIEFKTWTTLEYEIALKYALRNCTGWVYYRDKKFIFENDEDFVLFRMWAADKPMHESDMLEIK